MSRWLAIATAGAIVAAHAGTAAAEDPVATEPTATAATDALREEDQGVGGAVGIASGGRVTPGGLRISGHYLYQLSSSDWFDGTAAFTYGSGAGGCFRDRMDTLICEHGFAEGTGLELEAGVRRMFAAQGSFRPFARLALGLAVVSFGGDDLTGVVLPLHAGGGIRARVAPAVALVASGEVVIGIGAFNRGLGIEPQLGIAITAGAEFRLR